MTKLNWSKTKKYTSDNINYETGKSLSYKDQEKIENRKVLALLFIQSYQGNSNFINSLKNKRLISIKQVKVIEEIQKNYK